ncbi:squalene synthase HpnC [Paludibaculum fermentans]|uniref:squalene synthase HpnC n=1 Tax=Paludibaculum fermentans TaxID=1473598 RepID=UPI003EBBDE71
MQLQPVEFLKSQEAMTKAWSTDQALSYTHWLATHHYENFNVVSFLLPKHLHQDFYNVYSFCRWSDDLGDEIGDTAESLRLLAWWRGELRGLYQGVKPTHPVFVALAPTIERHKLPIDPFDNLLTAFIQDQTVTRYDDWAGVMGYCVNSANPVGRLVLMLCGYRDEERFRLSDATCSALQLANFWQDVTVDLKKDRVYLPLHLFRKHGYTVEELFGHRNTPAFRKVMVEAVDYAQELFETGLPLIGKLDRRLALDIDLFSRGGMKVLDKIRAQDYDVLKGRPVVSKPERAMLLLRSLLRAAVSKAA